MSEYNVKIAISADATAFKKSFGEASNGAQSAVIQNPIAKVINWLPCPAIVKTASADRHSKLPCSFECCRRAKSVFPPWRALATFQSMVSSTSCLGNGISQINSSFADSAKSLKKAASGVNASLGGMTYSFTTAVAGGLRQGLSEASEGTRSALGQIDGVGRNGGCGYGRVYEDGELIESQSEVSLKPRINAWQSTVFVACIRVFGAAELVCWFSLTGKKNLKTDSMTYHAMPRNAQANKSQNIKTI
jgi:hypothetical protein